MSRAVGVDGPVAFRRCQTPRRAEGLKLVRLLPDPQAPGFRDDAERQAAALKSAPDEHDALDFIEATADWSGDEERSEPT